MNYIKNWVSAGGVYTDKKTGAYCIAVLTILDRVEFVAASKKSVVTGITTWTKFHDRFIESSTSFDVAFKVLSSNAHRHGAEVRAHELLALIGPAREGEVEMATKKPAAEKKAAAPKKGTPKKGTPKKEAPKKEAGATRGRKGAFDPSMKITVSVDKNPKRGGAAARFDLYAKNNTVEKYLAAGGLMADIRWDVKQAFIKVE